MGCWISFVILLNTGCDRLVTNSNSKHAPQDYESLLVKSINKGYIVIPVYEWVKNKENYLDKKVIIMRHDVDWDAETAKKLATFEYKHGAQATYYFRWKTADSNPINYIKKLKHEIGLHYETLADYSERNNITQKEQVTRAVRDTCRSILKTEIEQFEKLYGEINSICSHGAERNWQIGLPNLILISGFDPHNFGVETYANAPEVFEGVDIFVADSGNKWDPFSLDEAIDQNYQIIYVLIHPIWWKG